MLMRRALAADEELDFGVCSDDDPLSRCLAGALRARIASRPSAVRRRDHAAARRRLKATDARRFPKWSTVRQRHHW